MLPVPCCTKLPPGSSSGLGILAPRLTAPVAANASERSTSGGGCLFDAGMLVDACSLNAGASRHGCLVSIVGCRAGEGVYGRWRRDGCVPVKGATTTDRRRRWHRSARAMSGGGLGGASARLFYASANARPLSTRTLVNDHSHTHAQRPPFAQSAEKELKSVRTKLIPSLPFQSPLGPPRPPPLEQPHAATDAQPTPSRRALRAGRPRPGAPQTSKEQEGTRARSTHRARAASALSPTVVAVAAAVDQTPPPAKKTVTPNQRAHGRPGRGRGRRPPAPRRGPPARHRALRAPRARGGGHLRRGVQGARPPHGRRRRVKKNPAGAGGGGRAVDGHPRDLAAQGDGAPQRREVGEIRVQDKHGGGGCVCPAAAASAPRRDARRERERGATRASEKKKTHQTNPLPTKTHQTNPLPTPKTHHQPTTRRSATKRTKRSLHDVLHAESRLYLVFEFLDLDLKRLMDAAGAREFGRDGRRVKLYLWQMLNGIAYCHSRR